MTRPDYIPISADPEPWSRRQRMRTVAANMRARRVEKAGGLPCETCGGGIPQDHEGDDVCRCGGGEWLGTLLTARCLSNAQRSEAS